MKTTSEMSPLVETIEVSETLMIEGGETSRFESDISATPSDWKNGKVQIFYNSYSFSNSTSRCEHIIFCY